MGVAVTLWMVWNVRRLRDYALSVQGPADGERHDRPALPGLARAEVPGELGDLARAMDRMRARLEGSTTSRGYVRALTHELKAPVAAIRGLASCCGTSCPPPTDAEFATQVVQQSERDAAHHRPAAGAVKLEQRQHAEGPRPWRWRPR